MEIIQSFSRRQQIVQYSERKFNLLYEKMHLMFVFLQWHLQGTFHPISIPYRLATNGNAIWIERSESYMLCYMSFLGPKPTECFRRIYLIVFELFHLLSKFSIKDSTMFLLVSLFKTIAKDSLPPKSLMLCPRITKRLNEIIYLSWISVYG